MVWGRRCALRASVAILVAMWAYEAVTRAQRGDAETVRSVSQIARFVVINGAIRLAVIAALLRWGGEGAGAIGLRRAGLLGQIARGAGFGVLIFVVSTLAVSPVVSALLQAPPDDNSRIAHLFADRSELPLWLFCGVIGGGLVEELSRVFALTRCERFAGRAGLIIALVIDTTVFGMGHLYQGVPGALTAGFSGLANAFVFLRKRSAVEAIAAHAVYDVVGILAAYALYSHTA